MRAANRRQARGNLLTVKFDFVSVKIETAWKPLGNREKGQKIRAERLRQRNSRRKKKKKKKKNYDEEKRCLI